MEELESKLSALAADPKIMQQVMALARQLGKPDGSAQESAPSGESGPVAGGPELSALAALAGTGKNANPDREQQALLRALRPYLSAQRIQKLERAMRAAKMAAMASAFIKPSGR